MSRPSPRLFLPFALALALIASAVAPAAHSWTPVDTAPTAQEAEPEFTRPENWKTRFDREGVCIRRLSLCHGG